MCAGMVDGARLGRVGFIAVWVRIPPHTESGVYA